jgi:hypothetical protein
LLFGILSAVILCGFEIEDSSQDVGAGIDNDIIKVFLFTN